MIHIETSRLILRDWEPDDIEPFRRMNQDPEVMKFFPRMLSSDETDQFFNKIQREFADYGYGLYAAEVKETQEFIGFIGFHRADFGMDFTPCIEIGYRLKKEAWGNGYATEGARACLEFGFREFRFDGIYSFTAKLNAPSQKVMKNIGMRFIKEFDHPNVPPDSPLHPHVLFFASSQ